MWKLSVSQSFSSPYVHIKTVKARGKTASFPFFKFDGHGFHCATTPPELGGSCGCCWEQLRVFVPLAVSPQLILGHFVGRHLAHS